MPRKKYPDPQTQRLWNSYRSMRQTCYNPNNSLYQAYQRAGLAPRVEFGSFREFADYVITRLGPEPFPGARLARRDMREDYRRGNLIWSTQKEQQRRQRRCHQIRFRGQRYCLSEWAERLNQNPHKFYNRIRSGVSRARDILDTEDYRGRA